ncbi:MAG: MMPL family transporter, partial [Polyangiales bacterium]
STLSFRFLTHDPFEENLRNLGSESPELAEAGSWMGKFDREFGGGIDGGFVIATDDRAQALAIATHLRGVDAGKSSRERIFSNIETIEDRLPKDQDKKLALLKEIRTKLDRAALPRTKGKEHDDLLALRPPDELRALTPDDLPKALALAFTERDGTRGRLVLLNIGAATDTGNVPSLRNFAAKVRGLDLPKGVLVGGGAFVISDVVEAMLRDGPRATLMSAIGALLVVAFAVGWGRYAFVTVVCGALGTLSLLSVAHLIGLKVNFLDFVALPITIGIGIDYAVNIAARARQAGASGRAAVQTTGGAVLLCSYTTVVGYASLLFSANKGIRSFGESAMIGELTCITTALIFAPALIDAITTILPVKPAPETTQ